MLVGIVLLRRVAGQNGRRTALKPRPCIWLIMSFQLRAHRPCMTWLPVSKPNTLTPLSCTTLPLSSTILLLLME